MILQFEPVAYARNNRDETLDDNWAGIVTEISLNDNLPEECFDGIEQFSHLEIVYFFHNTVDDIIYSGHPRGNPDWPRTGIFAQRKKDRPNHIGCTIVNLIRREGRKLIVEHFDGINRTPVLDIKPVMAEFLPAGEVRQPEWSVRLMEKYW